MSSIVTFLGGDPQFLTNYLFGLVTIILYAKDKFNTPTYDKESMGPFSQLPPQLLTIDARYRQGMRTYIFLLLALYTALCIIGPSTFSQQNIQLGFSADTNQFWPVASATFLISTGAAKDSSILGKIEHFIRQYAQKTAYIPSIVSNLAYSIRNVETIPWLKENKDKLKPDEFEERRATLTALIGEKFVTKINENPRQQGHLAAWARANIVFYCLQQMFRGVLPSEKLSQITEVPENVAIFERLKKEREQLEHRFIAVEEQRDRKSEPLAEGDLDKLLSDVQRFSKEVSLTIVVLLSQAVRTFSDLKERLEQLGFREIELRDNSDHRVYLVMVNFSILLGAFVSYALATGFATFTKWGALKNLPIISGWMPDAAARTELWNDFSVINHAGELLSVMTGVLIYMIVFKVIDYLREGYLDLSDWHENLQGYVTVVVMASLCSAVICILIMVLLLSPLGLLSLIWTDPAGLAQQFLFQFIVAGLAAGFAVSYLRHAVDLNWRNGGHKKWSRIILGEFVLFRESSDYIKVAHGALAAILVGVLTYAIDIHARNNAIEAAKSDLEIVLNSFDQNQGWLGKQAKAVQPRLVAADTFSVRNNRLQPSDLVDISCKLQNMYAAIHVFDVEARDFQLDPDFNEGNAAREFVGGTQCGGLKANDATIDNQISQLKAICSALNRVGMRAPQNGAPNSSAPQVQKGPPRSPPPGQPQGPAAANQEPGQRVLAPTLFLASEKCELSPLYTEIVDEQNFRSLGNSLSKLFFSLDSLNRIADGTHSAVIFPMITAFFIAYAFGAGCRVWRAWWLNNEAGQQEIEKLKDQIHNIYGEPIPPAEFERWLISPLNVLNNVAPKEAVRYEGLKARLYAKIESKQIDFGKGTATSSH